MERKIRRMEAVNNSQVCYSVNYPLRKIIEITFEVSVVGLENN